MEKARRYLRRSNAVNVINEQDVDVDPIPGRAMSNGWSLASLTVIRAVFNRF